MNTIEVMKQALEALKDAHLLEVGDGELGKETLDYSIPIENLTAAITELEQAQPVEIKALKNMLIKRTTNLTKCKYQNDVLQARIAELHVALEYCLPIMRRMYGPAADRAPAVTFAKGVLAKTDDLSAFNDLKARYEARIAELRDALEQVGCLMLCGKKDQLPGRCDNAAKVVKKVLTKPDDLSALEAVKARVKREALLEALAQWEAPWNGVPYIDWLRRMVGEVK